MSEAAFLTALRDGGGPAPKGLLDGRGRPAGRRFDVYRNNVAVALISALETAFPVLRKLLGASNFTLLARAYQAAHPPASPVMMFYGREMPEFLAAFAPTRDTGYLPDVARLELALRESYHAADGEPVDPAALGSLPPDRLAAMRLRLAPSLRILRSDWPVFSIWHFNSVKGAPKPRMTAEDVAVLRPRFDPEPHLLGPGAAEVLSALLAGRTLGEAAEAGPDADLSAVLSLLLGHGAITALEETP